MASNLRKRKPINYYEPEEPSFDEYIYCEACSDFVYEYCSIHGPLLVIPDDKVPTKINLPPYVPRAALTIPHVFLHLAPSIIPGAGLAVFSTLTLPRGVRFGPYCGRKTHSVDSTYCWQLYDRNQKASHVLDAGDANGSNWMRYVNCARHWREQNLVAFQYQGQLYYRTIKTIPRFTELMVFYGGEFAHRLHINLSKYNTDESYQEIIGTKTRLVHVTEINIANDMNNYNEIYDNLSEVIEPCFTDEKFEFIEDCYQNDETSVHNNYLDSQLRDAIDDVKDTTSKTVSFESGNIIIKFKNDFTSPHNCEICHKGFNAKKNMKQHLKVHIAAQKYACSECAFTTYTKYNLKRHSLSHTRAQNACTKRDNNSKRSCNFYVSEKKCTYCEFSTISRTKFYIHVSKHKGNVFKCDSCDYSSCIKSYLKKHMKRHSF